MAVDYNRARKEIETKHNGNGGRRGSTGHVHKLKGTMKNGVGLYVFITDDKEAFKVGISNDVNDRWGELQTGNHRKIELVFLWEFPDRETAREIERILHERLKRYRLSGEWFSDWASNQNRFFDLFEKYSGQKLNWREPLQMKYKIKKWIKTRPDAFWFLFVQVVFLVIYIFLAVVNYVV